VRDSIRVGAPAFAMDFAYFYLNKVRTQLELNGGWSQSLFELIECTVGGALDMQRDFPLCVDVFHKICTVPPLSKHDLVKQILQLKLNSQHT